MTDQVMETSNGRARLQTQQGLQPNRRPHVEAFHLIILPVGAGPAEENEDEGPPLGRILATYRNASALAELGDDERTRRRWADITRIQQRIKKHIEGDPSVPALPKDGELITYGTELFEILFSGEVLRLYDEARANQNIGRLNVILTSRIPRIADKPWEFAFDPTRGGFLATEEVNFVRNVFSGVPLDRIPVHPPPLRVLVVAAQPLNLAQLSVEDEIAVIRRDFARLVDQGAATVDVLDNATPQRFHELLELAGLREEPFDVVHFIGHGEYDQERKRGYLFFENGHGAVTPIDSRTFRQIISHRGINMVFLNACETGVSGRLDFTRGVAPDLVASGLPAVLANQFSVLDASATSFAQHFYWGLANGQCVGDAAREARVYVNSTIVGEAIDWAVPVVYTRDPALRLCEVEKSKYIPLEPPDPGRAGWPRRSGTRRDYIRVGVWDVNRALPKLPKFLERLNASQDRFLFQESEIAAPLGTWRLVQREGVAGGCIIGSEVALRLELAARSLGVDRLFCVTTFEIGDEGYGDEYLWEDEEDDPVPGKPAIAILSLVDTLDQGDDQQSQDNDDRQRGVVNSAVFVLSGLNAHEDGDKECVSYYNREREVAYITGQLSLCDECRRILAERGDGLLEPLEKLLGCGNNAVGADAPLVTAAAQPVQ